jgi:hypothetical protein
MSFSQATIAEVYPPAWTGSAIHLEWTSTSPSGTVFQVYADRRLTWHGTSRWVNLPMPRGRVRFDVGTVDAAEAATDFSAVLPSTPESRVRLSWLGGTYLSADGDDLMGFRIYGEQAPGGGIDFTASRSEIVAYPGGILNDGFGLGGFGQGGFGRSASAYSWTSPSLGRGTWSFAIVPFDHAGNEGTPMTAQATINAPPAPPPPDAAGNRLTYSYDPATRQVTLAWLPSLE